MTEPSPERTISPAVEDLLDAVRTDAEHADPAEGGPSPHAVSLFREAVWTHHAESRRDMPWRVTRDPWAVLVSEVMLQQTQVPRVLPKYEALLAAFPDPAALADAPLEDLLRLWKGLGYNRRAVALKRAAEAIATGHAGEVPRDTDALLALPGIGPATAAGVRCFAFGQCDVYLETNVRAVVLYAFFPDSEGVPDRDVRDVLATVLDRDDPREWHYALMDLGWALKGTRANPSRRSATFARQSPFEGSDRQVRSRALELVLERGPIPEAGLVEALDDERAGRLVEALVGEGMLAREDGRVRIA